MIIRDYEVLDSEEGYDERVVKAFKLIDSGQTRRAERLLIKVVEDIACCCCCDCYTSYWVSFEGDTVKITMHTVSGLVEFTATRSGHYVAVLYILM